MDSNHRTRKGADLQSAAFGHFAKPPRREIIHGAAREDLNPQPTDYKSVALPIELHRHIMMQNGGSGRNRTADTRIFSPLLYQLSYRARLDLIKVAELTGFEPAISCVTGRHVRPLHHSSTSWHVRLVTTATD